MPDGLSEGQEQVAKRFEELLAAVQANPDALPQVLGAFLFKPGELDQLRQCYADDLQSNLSILVTNPSGAGPPGAGYLLGPTGMCVKIPLPIKIMSECRRAVGHLIESLANPERIRFRSLAFYDLFRHDRSARSTVARTIRMLMYFEALFCHAFFGKLFDHEERHDIAWWKAHIGDNAWAHYYHEADRLTSSTTLPDDGGRNVLRAAIETVLGATIPLTSQGSREQWAASLVLLMLVAVTYSQLDHYLGNGWEYYSAGHARADLSSRAPFDKEPGLLDIVAFLIYYQSAPGQCARQTGSASFLETAEKIAKRLNIDRDLLVKAIRLMGVIEEARNHFAPDTIKADEIRYLGLPINYDLDRDWQSEDYSFSTHTNGTINVIHCPDDMTGKLTPRTAETAVKHILTCKTGEGATWAFTPKYIPDGLMKQFRGRVEEAAAAQFGRNVISLYSIGRRQSHKLQEVLRFAIQKVVDVPNSFDQQFDLRLVVLPSVLNPHVEEFLIEVWLNDVLAAKAQLGLEWR